MMMDGSKYPYGDKVTGEGVTKGVVLEGVQLRTHNSPSNGLRVIVMVMLISHQGENKSKGPIFQGCCLHFGESK
jgi:hypothetical protein